MISKFIHKMEEVFILEMMAHSVVLLRDNMNKKFTVEICSDLDFEEMVADVSYEKRTIALITQENGLNEMKIEIFHPEEEIKSWEFPLDEFIDTILFAKKRLIEMQKISDK